MERFHYSAPRRRVLPAWLPALLALAGCGYASNSWYDNAIRDVDGDGLIAERFGGRDCDDTSVLIGDCDADRDGARSPVGGGLDCDDEDPAVHPGAPERCDGIDNNCDGRVDNDDPTAESSRAWYQDSDGDGFGDPDEVFACQELRVPSDPSSGIHSALGTDCDDDDPAVNPNATELCDLIDNNCDGTTDDAGVWLVDDDGDGYGVDGVQANGPCVLGPDAGLTSVGGDCDDDEPGVNPGQSELAYDGVDQNCNGLRDEWDVDLDGFVPDAHWAAAQSYAASPGVSWVPQPGDCDDASAVRNPGQTEICDGVDNDCDDRVDAADLEGVGPGDEPLLRSQVTTVYTDEDGDGFPGSPLVVCDIAGRSLVATDCLDVASAGIDPAQVNPAATEQCDGFDNDCDGRADWSAVDFPGSGVFFIDEDGDGVGAAQVFACGTDPFASIVVLGDDCNDGNPTAFPGAPEVCGDPVRQDCNVDVSLYDCDGDGFEGAYGTNGSGADCNDRQAAVNELAQEVCDGLDNDCDGATDSADDSVDLTELPSWYPDADADGFGTGTPLTGQCDAPAGHALLDGDCDDTDPFDNPAAPWFFDSDGDGFGQDASATITGCVSPGPGWVRDGGDCNDSDPELHPDTLWLLDQDGDFAGDPSTAAQFCLPTDGANWVRADNGEDCNDTDPDIQAALTWYADADSDGFGDPAVSDVACVAPIIGGIRYVATVGDCNDADSGVHPLRDEVCNGLDDDCDGDVDDGDTNLVAPATGPLGFQDLDGDGVGSSIGKTFCFAVPPDWSEATGDCDDADPAIFPGAIEICGNGVDDDCNGDESEPDWYEDLDGDGFGTVYLETGCTAPADGATRAGDCDDTDSTTFPGAAELDACDAIDSDCDGAPEPLLVWFFDGDSDGYGDDATATSACSAPLDPPAAGLVGDWILTGGDCDDADPSSTFGRIWYVDGDGDGLGEDGNSRFACPQFDPSGEALSTWLFDDVDGDGEFDPGDGQLAIFGGDCDDTSSAIGAPQLFYPDVDGDTWGAATGELACPGPAGGPPAGTVVRTGDCDDTDGSINPEATEVDGDGVDSNCDGFEGAADDVSWYADNDGDGFGTGFPGAYQPGRVPNAADCDDTDPDVGGGLFVFEDSDTDGFGGGAPIYAAGCAPPSGFTVQGGDCDDADDAIHPARSEVCDGIDQDCDGRVDEGVLSSGFLDRDGDGHGSTSHEACADDPELAGISGDCDDGDPTIHPGAVDVCDGVDNDCDGVEPTSTFYMDLDGDGDGAPDTSISACEAPSAGWVSSPTDCDDLDATVYAGAPELCDGLDNDCVGGVPAFETDADGDGFMRCEADCNDAIASVHPGATELCDGLDNDCDGAHIDGDPDVSNPFTGSVPVGSLLVALGDRDGDGALSYNTPIYACEAPSPSGVLEITGRPDVDYGPVGGALHDCDRTTGADTGALFLADADGDGLGVFDATTRVVCAPDVAPSGYAQHINGEDCAPSDPFARFTVGPGEYGDGDGDGRVAPFTDTGACVGKVQDVPGEDCNDGDPATIGNRAGTPVVVGGPLEFDALIGACEVAEFTLPMSVDTIELERVQPEAQLTFSQPGWTNCSLVSSSGCVDLQGSPDNEATLQFRDIGVSGFLDGAGLDVTLESATLRGAVQFDATGVGFLARNSTLALPPGDSLEFSSPTVEPRFENVVIDGSDTGIALLGGGATLHLDEVTFNGRTRALLTGAPVVGRQVQFNGNRRAIDLRDTTADLVDVTLRPAFRESSVGYVLVGNSTLDGENWVVTNVAVDSTAFHVSGNSTVQIDGITGFGAAEAVFADIVDSDMTVEDVSLFSWDRAARVRADAPGAASFTVRGGTISSARTHPHITTDTGFADIVVEDALLQVSTFDSNPFFYGEFANVTLDGVTTGSLRQPLANVRSFGMRDSTLQFGGVAGTGVTADSIVVHDSVVRGLIVRMFSTPDLRIRGLFSDSLPGRLAEVQPGAVASVDGLHIENANGDVIIASYGTLEVSNSRFFRGSAVPIRIEDGFGHVDRTLFWDTSADLIDLRSGSLLVERTTMAPRGNQLAIVPSAGTTVTVDRGLFHSTTGGSIPLLHCDGTITLIDTWADFPSTQVDPCAPTYVGTTGGIATTGPPDFDTDTGSSPTYLPMNPNVSSQFGETAP